MTKISAVVLVLDRLGAGWLGPYGNTWLDTPNFNRLAARSVLFETAIAATPDLAQAYRGFWTGRHALQRDVGDCPLLPELAAANGLAVLLTDDETVAAHNLAASFSERHVVQPKPVSSNADSVEQTGLYAFFEAAASLVAKQEQPGLVWLHSLGMSGAWDAPLELRYQFADEEDPEPPAFTKPPEAMLDARCDPDELLGLGQAYAGQVALADMCLGMLLDAVDSSSRTNETLLVVTSPRGYPLGEHRRVGPCDQALYGELLHVPLLVQLPGREQALTRTQQIVQPLHLFDLLSADETKLAELFAEPRTRSHAAYSIGSGQRAIRTPAWFLRERNSTEQITYELFAKPDDRLEANEISSLCAPAVELLAAELNRFTLTTAALQLSESPPLAELLCDTWR